MSISFERKSDLINGELWADLLKYHLTSSHHWGRGQPASLETVDHVTWQNHGGMLVGCYHSLVSWDPVNTGRILTGITDYIVPGDRELFIINNTSQPARLQHLLHIYIGWEESRRRGIDKATRKISLLLFVVFLIPMSDVVAGGVMRKQLSIILSHSYPHSLTVCRTINYHW